MATTVAGRYGHGPMWTYELFDPERDGDEAERAAKLAAEGWRTWAAGLGPWITLEGRRLRRWSLRREVGLLVKTLDPPPSGD